MASTNKTPQLGLNQWAAGDEVLRADFNGDNAKLDVAVEANRLAAIAAATAAANAVIKIASAKFFGDGKTNRPVNIGFRPKILFVLYPMPAGLVEVVAENIGFQFNSSNNGGGGGIYGLSPGNINCLLSDTGFVIKKAENNNANNHGCYLAIG